MLEVSGLNVLYGGIRALKGVSLTVSEGKIVALIGANGAGKSTLLKAISGLVPIGEGRVTFEGRTISGYPPERIVAAGISQIPEGRQIFAPLKVIDNLRLGAFLFRGQRHRAETETLMEYVYQVFPVLRDRANQIAGTLSGGEQQMLAIGRALMSRPKLLILDEPSMGLAPLLVREIFGVIETLNQEGRTVLLVEQNARAALHVADYAYVLETGSITAEGPSQKLLGNEEIRKAY
ncbi:MAG: ABC transporter ATP-binding protein [Deltaproteobacteria bacterium]|nr:ABC transporter ATP-binding protein [Deltaproteobacteria bacterium]